ncbi:MAG: RNA polymerase sporulation sigma factor SigH [Inconstantimicrobium porci]|uniref:RNA polymerase sporulation sigma factor SigH n=1 Tax=Inconstantimicrobium porci TaxID=2652291 RepID=UPI002A913ED0|nr:RNA polymerase sporulation sigma factor SigH [Inconstantimicrobium porci]MDY5911742.1 RNA polymerase sporulation sigma factor SigH [Inconstantimicrobium porci]
MSGSTYAEVNYDFKCMKDEEVVCIAQKGNKKAQEYMINKYESCVKAKAKSYFLIGADKEDIYQEGMIGLYKAIRDFNSGRQASFKAFAELCISRQIITAIKTATRQKHIPLNTYISLNKPIYDDESDRTLLDILSSIRVCNPEELIVSQEEMVQIEKYMAKSLSELEKQVLNSYMDGKTYQEIACTLDRDAKSIDNALQRVKKKLENCLKY